MSVLKIYVLVHTGRSVSGHGETAPYINLAVKSSYGTDVHPAFRTRHNAEEYIAAWEKNHYTPLEIKEMELI